LHPNQRCTHLAFDFLSFIYTYLFYRLRLERIKRNQERLAALGLQDGSLKPKAQKPQRRKFKPKVPLETRERISRSSKKRIDYSQMPQLWNRDDFSSSKKKRSKNDDSYLRELTPEEIARREKRKNERKPNERIPRFIYNEFNRITKTRRQGVKIAKRHVGKARREKEYWERITRKLTAQENQIKKVREMKAKKQQMIEEEQLREENERLEFDCNGMTKNELLDELAIRTPELYGILSGYDREYSATLRKHQLEMREQEEIRKRQSLERKLAVIDAFDRFPKAMNEALNKLNALLYSRAPKNRAPARRSGRQKHEAAYHESSVSKSNEHVAKGKNTKFPFVAPTAATASVLESLPSNQSGYEQTQSPKKKRKLNVSRMKLPTHKKNLIIPGDSIAAPAAFLPPSPTIPAANDSTKKKKRGRPKKSLPSPLDAPFTYMASPMNERSLPSPYASVQNPMVPPMNERSFQQPFVPIYNPVTSPVNDGTKKKRGRPKKSLPSPLGAFPTTMVPPVNERSFQPPFVPVYNPIFSPMDDGTKKKRGRSRLSLPLHSHALEELPPPSQSQPSNELPVPAAESTEASRFTAKRPKKGREPRFVGGWISPKFSKELDRTWLERIKPIDNRPVILVPEGATKLAGISAKKTAVFDLGRYIPQAGDIILYYPSAHKDVLNIYPDTLGSRRRNLLRVPLWARANREKNRLLKEEQKGTIWWTDEWVESLLSARSKSKRDREIDAAKAAHGKNFSARADNNRVESNRNASLGDYPIICRVEKTHVEFPEDPYAKTKNMFGGSMARGFTDGMVEENVPDTTVPQNAVQAKAPRLSLLAEAEVKKKRDRIRPQIRLAVVLKALSPVVAPSESSALDNGATIGLAPNFTVVTFPVKAPLEPFIIPFCWAYSSFHTMMANETIWIRSAASFDNDGSRNNMDSGLCGKGKIVDFFNGAMAKKSNPAGKQEIDIDEEALTSTSELTDRVGNGNSIRLQGNLDELNALLDSFAKVGSSDPEAIAASFASEKYYKDFIPIREACILVDYFRKYLEHLALNADTPKTSQSSLPQENSTTPITSENASPSLVGLILKTLPLRRGVLVSYDSNRRQLQKASSWNLVTLQPTNLSQSLQNGLLGYLDNSFREKVILCMKDQIKNNSNAKPFIPMVTELIAPSYFCAVPVGMSIDRVLARLKAFGDTGSCYYTSMESILMDLNLILENCLLYNNPESILVAQCNDIIPKCQTLIQNIIQNGSTKIVQKNAETDLGGKRQGLVVPSFLNTPFKEKLNWEWLQQITPSSSNTNDGEKVTRQALSSTWFPQCGESIFYSKSNHSKFVSDHRSFLDDTQCSIPDFQLTETEHKTFEANQKENRSENDFVTQTSTHWLEGTVISVRSSFPKPAKGRNSGVVPTLTPLLIVELCLHYSQCKGNLFVCWKPLFDGTNYQESGLSYDSFLKPTWISTDGMQILPSNLLQANAAISITKDMSISITRCLDLLKQRCIDGIAPDAVNVDVALESAEHGITSNFDSSFLPSYTEFFTSSDVKHSTRGIKRAAHKAAINPLSRVGYMPLWSHEAPRKRSDGNRPRHELWMSFPSLCLELVRLRISAGYYKNLHAVVNDISESYIECVLFLLSAHWTRSEDKISIRKISKYLLSSKGNGKMARISVKKSSKKKMSEEGEMANSLTIIPEKKKPRKSKETPFDKLSENEVLLIQRVSQIRKYHATAIVFALETKHVEKIFCLTSPDVPTNISNKVPDPDVSKTTNFTPDQLDGVAKIRRLLQAAGRDSRRNRSKFSWRNLYKVKIKCGKHIITENGQLEMIDSETIRFQPNSMVASLPDGSTQKIRVRCGNQYIYGKQKIVTDQPFGVHINMNENGLSSQYIDPNNFYHVSSVGRSHFNFNQSDITKNEDLVRSLFGRPERMHPCVRCQVLGESLYRCRVARQHSNPDYDLEENFKGTSGIDSLLTPWKKSGETDTGSTAASRPPEIHTNKDVTALNHSLASVDEEAKKIAAATKIAEEKLEADQQKLSASIEMQASEARANLEKADEAQKLAKYLYAQAILLFDHEVKLSEEFIASTFPIDTTDNHYVFCIHCGCAGDLLVCDGCRNVSHPKCAGLTEVPDGDWFCHKCTAKKALTSKTFKCTVVASTQPHEDIAKSSEEANQPEASTSSQKDKAPETSGCAMEKIDQGEYSKQEIPTETKDSLETKTNSTGTRDDSKSNELGAGTEPDTKIEDGSSTHPTEGNESKSNELGGGTELGTKIDDGSSTHPTASSEKMSAEAVKSQEQPSQINTPELNDKEFEEKASELSKVLTELYQKRLPTKSKAIEQDQPPHEQEETSREPLCDPMDVLDTFAREFLSFLEIESAEAFISTQTALIAKDLDVYRKEKGMKPLAERTLLSTVSTWKTSVRKASIVASNQVTPANKARNGLHVLPAQGQAFCAYIGITDAQGFMAITASRLIKKYASWRKQQNMTKLSGSGNEYVMNS